MKKKRPIVLSIAGFDPSGGAGVLADLKTFEQLKCQGLAVITANTIQSATKFVEVNWIDVKTILLQLDVLLTEHQVSFVKIGIVQNSQVLLEIVKQLRHKAPKVKIIWDPVLKTSTGFDFGMNVQELREIFSEFFMITPNWNEIMVFGKLSAKEIATEISALTKVFLKGGHSDEIGKDFLFVEGEQKFVFTPSKGRFFDKHGSGCVLSSAITAHLANQYPLHKSCLGAKKYVENYLKSTKDLLGYHHRT